MHAELDIFSGRPNPAWPLTDEEAATLQAMTASLPAAAAPSQSDGLGYRGIVVRNPGDSSWSLTVFRDTVQILTAAKSDVRFDADATIERWLLGTAGDAVDAALLARLGYSNPID